MLSIIIAHIYSLILAVVKRDHCVMYHASVQLLLMYKIAFIIYDKVERVYMETSSSSSILYI